MAICWTKQLSFWFSACAVLYLMSSFPFGVFGRMVDVISVPGHCGFFYFSIISGENGASFMTVCQ